MLLTAVLPVTIALESTHASQLADRKLVTLAACYAFMALYFLFLGMAIIERISENIILNYLPAAATMAILAVVLFVIIPALFPVTDEEAAYETEYSSESTIQLETEYSSESAIQIETDSLQLRLDD